jgi:hypothetical protein
LLIHCAWVSVAPRPSRMAGSAMAMIVPSMKPSAEARIAAISRKRRSLSRQKPGAWPGFGVGVASGPPDWIGAGGHAHLSVFGGFRRRGRRHGTRHSGRTGAAA